MELLGGREIHPINVRVGGFYRAPTRPELEVLLPELRWAREATAECLHWMADFSFPELERDYEFVALRHPDEYPFCEGRLVSSRGLDIDCDAGIVTLGDASKMSTLNGSSVAVQDFVLGAGDNLIGYDTDSGGTAGIGNAVADLRPARSQPVRLGVVGCLLDHQLPAP